MTRVQRPNFQLTCGACCQPVPRAQDVHVIDAEWVRRWKGAKPLGRIICERCGLLEGGCRVRGYYGGPFIKGHILTTRPGRGDDDLDLWDHRIAYGTQVAMVMLFPHWGMRQGAMDFVWALASDPQVNVDIRRQCQEATIAAQPVQVGAPFVDIAPGRS